MMIGNDADDASTTGEWEDTEGTLPEKNGGEGNTIWSRKQIDIM
jgi:hypothetical protein